MKWKLATFNVNGIRARMPILLDWLAAARPDVLCLQETKVQDKDFPVFTADYIPFLRSLPIDECLRICKGSMEVW